MRSALSDFTLVGSGALGAVLGRSLVRQGLRLNQLVVRRKQSAHKLIDELGQGEVVELKDWTGTDSNLVLIATLDDQVENVSNHLAQRGGWQNKVVLHTSGSLNKEALKSLADNGASVGSFHPLQSFVGTEDGTAFKGITIGVEGDPLAVETARQLADALLADAVEISSENKALYHASAVLAGNAAITLLSVSEELWEKAAGSGTGFSATMGPLLKTSVQNTLTYGPHAALTGPIERGDVGTLTMHFKAISTRLPHLLAFYGSVTTETIHLAVRSGRLSAEKAVELLDVISLYVVGEAASE
ncbi:MAG: DUF2520 domain-containing protein [Bacteroidetes bacterium]|nr:DUF2520 domain-containing protein [Bacteroidota bacterium]